MVSKNKDGSILVKGASYELLIRGHIVDFIIGGTAFASLDVRSAADITNEDGSVTADVESSLPVLTEQEIRPGEAVFLWKNKSSLWEKEYRLCCSYVRFSFHLTLHGKGRVDSVNYFSGDMTEPGHGSIYEFSEGYNPCKPYNTAESYYFRPGDRCFRPSILMVPPMFCYSFRCEGISDRMALGLVAERGQHNFHSFVYNTSKLHNYRSGFWLSTDQDGHTEVDGSWTAPYIIGYSATDDMNTLQKYSDYYYSSGIAKARKPRELPRFWRGPLACGWIEQGANPDGCREELYERMISRFEENDLHPKAIIIDDKWMSHYATLEADRDKWPDLRTFIDRHHARGLNTMLWVMLWSRDGWDDSLCVTGEDNPLVFDPSRRVVDPSHPLFIENLDRAMERLFSNAEGCYDCDGLKLDYAFANPKGRNFRTYSGKYGVELMYELMARIYQKAKEFKPTALINHSACHPYFGHICDQARLHDYAPTERCNFEDLSQRGKLFSIAMPGVLLDTDNSAFVTRRDSMRWQLNQQTVGVPDLYRVSPNTVFDMNEKDLGAIAQVWREYSAKIDAMYEED